MTIPNALTLLRILAIPFFAIALWYGHLFEACAIFAAAGLTDLLDGFIARRFNQKSSLGEILDPAADKLLMTTAFILLTWRTQHLVTSIPPWVSILAISRDVVISIFSLIALAQTTVVDLRPSFWGKLTTGLQLVAISISLLINALHQYLGDTSWRSLIVPWIYFLVAFMTLASGLHYFFNTNRQLADKL